MFSNWDLHRHMRFDFPASGQDSQFSPLLMQSFQRRRAWWQANWKVLPLLTPSGQLSQQCQVTASGLRRGCVQNVWNSELDLVKCTFTNQFQTAIGFYITSVQSSAIRYALVCVISPPRAGCEIMQPYTGSLYIWTILTAAFPWQFLPLLSRRKQAVAAELELRDA